MKDKQTKIDLSAGLSDLEAANKVKSIQQSFESGKMSRRAFMTGALSLGVSLTSASLVVNRAEAATPKRGGSFRQAVTGGASSDVLDPGLILDQYMINLQSGQLRNNLTEIAANGELIPELAESWEVSPDAKVWHLKIRKGVEFSNGKSLTSEDVVDSLNHHLNKDSKSAAKSILGGIAELRADGKHAVNVTLKGGDADFPFLLSDFHLNVCPSNGDGTIDWQSGIGTGGYVLKDHDPGVRSLTTRNPNYWKEGRAHFDEVETIQVADANSRTSGLRSGAVDAMQGVELKTVHLLERVSEIVVKSVTGNKQFTLPMRTDTAPYDNNDLRTAVKHVIDREQWLKTIIFGYGELGNDNPIGPANVYRATNEELPQREYDVDKAKYHLKKAGYSKISLQFHAADTGFAGSVDAGQLMRESAAPAGIDIQVIREPNDGYWSDVWMKKPWVACNWLGRPIENWMFSQVYAADASWNDTYWKHEKFNKLLVQGRTELDSTKRREIYVEMQRIVHNEGGVALPLFVSDVMAHSDKIMTPETIGNNLPMDGAKSGERWWFA